MSAYRRHEELRRLNADEIKAGNHGDGKVGIDDSRMSAYGPSRHFAGSQNLVASGAQWTLVGVGAGYLGSE